MQDKQTGSISGTENLGEEAIGQTHEPGEERIPFTHDFDVLRVDEVFSLRDALKEITLESSKGEVHARLFPFEVTDLKNTLKVGHGSLLGVRGKNARKNVRVFLEKVNGAYCFSPGSIPVFETKNPT